MFKKYFLLLTLLVAIIYFWPTLHYQYILSQEDHGRDLYTFAQIAQGKHLYKDMWWEYGPIMPYYYALFNIIFGLKISSVLFGKFILNVICCIFFYLASCEVMSASWAFFSACFFMIQNQDFFYTYNHTGGVVFLLVILWLILKDLPHGRTKNKFWILGLCLLIGFVKINFGFSALVATVFSVFVIEKQKSKLNIFYLIGLVLVPLAWIFVYYFLLKGLTITEINQCLPYFGDNKTIVATPWQSLEGYWNQIHINFLTDWLALLESATSVSKNYLQLINPIKCIFFLMFLLRVLIYPFIIVAIITSLTIVIKNNSKNNYLNFWKIQLILWSFIILNLHEFIVSNIWYRSFWSLPFILFFIFYMIFTSLSDIERKFRYVLSALFIFLFISLTVNQWLLVKNFSKSENFLTAKLGQIYVGNDTEWVNTFNTVSEYLNTHLKKNELFFVMPCDSLFYYLTNKPAPSRQTIFFNLFHITPKQEISVINELEKNEVNYVLLSNRINNGSLELGVFGKTYCPLIFQYLKRNFIPFYQYGGNWNAPAGWASNHGVIILKRKL